MKTIPTKKGEFKRALSAMMFCRQNSIRAMNKKLIRAKLNERFKLQLNLGKSGDLSIIPKLFSLNHSGVQL